MCYSFLLLPVLLSYFTLLKLRDCCSYLILFTLSRIYSVDHFSFTYFRYYENTVITTTATFTMQNSHCTWRRFGQPKYSTPFFKKNVLLCILLCIGLWDHYCPRSMVALIFYSHCYKIFTPCCSQLSIVLNYSDRFTVCQ